MTQHTFATPYDEYQWLRRQLGFDPWQGMVPSVWNRCESNAQEDLLRQLRDALAHQDGYTRAHGEARRATATGTDTDAPL